MLCSRRLCGVLILLLPSLLRGEDGSRPLPSSIVLQPAAQLQADLASTLPGGGITVDSNATLTKELIAVAATDRTTESTRVLSFEEEVARLKTFSPNSTPLRQVRLAEAVQLLADEAQMKYIAPPDADFSERLTLSVRLNPKELLDILGERFGFLMEYDEHGVWHFYRPDANELITKAYLLRFNNLNQVQITAPSINASLSGSGGVSGGSSSNARSGQSTGASPFQAKAEGMVEELKKLLTVAASGHLGAAAGDPDHKVVNVRIHAEKETPEPKIIYSADTSQLFIVATRQQHALVEKYLAVIDQPLLRVKIAVKFVETARDPRRDFGIDWSGTPIGPQGGPLAISGGSDVNSRLTTPLKLSNFAATKLPQAVLSGPAFQLTLQAFATDHMSSVVEDPTLVTTNNKEVTFKATTQQPVQQSSTNIGSATTTSTAQIVYLEIGPNISILPSVLPGSAPGHELIQLSISIVTSTIVGQTIIAGNPYPIISSKTYQYSVPVENGFTLAFAGLDERMRQTNDKKVPLFGDIPVLGYAFKSRSENSQKTTLMAFITPTIESTAEKTTVPIAETIPAKARRIFEGSPTESISQLRQSLQGMETEISALGGELRAKNSDATLNHLDRLGVELELMEIRLEEWKSADKKTFPAEEKIVADDKYKLQTMRERLSRL